VYIRIWLHERYCFSSCHGNLSHMLRLHTYTERLIVLTYSFICKDEFFSYLPSRVKSIYALKLCYIQNLSVGLVSTFAVSCLPRLPAYFVDYLLSLPFSVKCSTFTWKENLLSFVGYVSLLTFPEMSPPIVLLWQPPCIVAWYRIEF